METESKQVLSIRIMDKLFGIPINHIQDVLKAQPVTTVPLAEPYINGVMNLRGRIVTVINLPIYLGMTTESQDQRMNVVIDYQNELFSFLVDDVHDVMNLHAEMIKELPITLDPLWRSISDCIYPVDDNLMVILSPEAIIKTFSRTVTDDLSV